MEQRMKGDNKVLSITSILLILVYIGSLTFSGFNIGDFIMIIIFIFSSLKNIDNLI